MPRETIASLTKRVAKLEAELKKHKKTQYDVGDFVRSSDGNIFVCVCRDDKDEYYHLNWYEVGGCESFWTDCFGVGPLNSVLGCVKLYPTFKEEGE